MAAGDAVLLMAEADEPDEPCEADEHPDVNPINVAKDIDA